MKWRYAEGGKRVTRACAWILRFDSRKPRGDQAVECKREATARIRHVGMRSSDWYCTEHAQQTKLLDELIDAAYGVLNIAEGVNVTTARKSLRRALRKLNHAMLLIALEPPDEGRTRGNEARSRKRRRRAKGGRSRARK